jgi:hypothetical protein
VLWNLAWSFHLFAAPFSVPGAHGGLPLFAAHQRQPLPDAPMAMDQLVSSGVYPKTIAERIEFNNTCVPHPDTNRLRL